MNASVRQIPQRSTEMGTRSLTWEGFVEGVMAELLLEDRWGFQVEKRGKGSQSSGRLRSQGQAVEGELRSKWVKGG